MRISVISVLLVVACASHAAEGETKATRKIDGVTTTFPAKAIEAGVKATVGVLESCTFSSDRKDTVAADLKKALRGDHARLAFAKPIKVKVGGKEYEASEAVYSATGFWLLRFGNQWLFCSKYNYKEHDRFLAWFGQTLPAD
jgi:hypothetical protein